MVEKRAWSESFTPRLYHQRWRRRARSGTCAALLSSLTKGMSTPRGPDRWLPGRGRPALPPAPELQRSTRDLLLGTWAGRLFIISASLKLVVALLRLLVDLSPLISILS